MTLLISEIVLKDVRCYENVTINLEGDEGPHSLLIAGNNGSGKSALLRSIAMGLCDQASAGSLLRELLGDFIRKQSNPDGETRKATIIIKLKDFDTKKMYEVGTRLTTYSELGFEIVEQELKGPDGKLEQIEFPWHRIFIAAYGAGLRTEGTEDYAQYFAGDAVYTLFKYAHTLQNPELVWRRLRVATKENSGRKKVDREIESKLLKILNLKTDNPTARSKNKVSLQENGIHVTSDWGKQELDALGDGYRALITMTMDIVGWQLLRQNNKTILEEIETGSSGDWRGLEWTNIDGIVIIDELEKHLHPSLQRKVLARLQEIFPKLQFIISTHSPLCVASVADVNNEFKIFRTTKDSNARFDVEEWKADVNGMRTDQILERIFEVDYLNEKTLAAMEEFTDLYFQKSDSDDEKRELIELREELSTVAPLEYFDLNRRLMDRKFGEGGAHEKKRIFSPKEIRRHIPAYALVATTTAAAVELFAMLFGGR